MTRGGEPLNSFIQIEGKKSWNKGYFENIFIEENGISLDSSASNSGIYLGEIIDSKEYEHEWYRMNFEMDLRFETRIVLNVLALESIDFIESLIKNEDIFSTDIFNSLMELESEKFENTSEILLHNLKGRYLIYWFQINSEGQSHIIKKLKIYYKKFSWLNYLPEIYSEDSSFLERYLAIFQTIFEDFEKMIDDMPQIYMPEKTRKDFLETLNKWLIIEGFNNWSEDKKRYLLTNYHEINRIRGTRRGLEKIIQLFTGEYPFIVEFIDFKNYISSSYQKKLYKKLYFDNPYGVSVLIKSKYLTGKKNFQAIREIIEEFTPVQAKCKIIPLNDYIVLGEHAYLEINSYIYNQSEMKLDEKSMMSIGVLSSDKNR